MNAAGEHPEAYGVFKPVGHVVVSFAPEADLQGAVNALLGEGFGQDEVIVYSSLKMKRQCEADIAQAGVLSTVGQELNLVKALRDLADQGYGFVMVRASKDEAVQRVAAVARRFHAQRAQKFGRLVIEELISVGSDDKQVAESPDRGLDAQTRSGREGEVRH
jgi:hypothetical protein